MLQLQFSRNAGQEKYCKGSLKPLGAQRQDLEQIGLGWHNYCICGAKIVVKKPICAGVTLYVLIYMSTVSPLYLTLIFW